jgi:hypothetical protein
MPPDGALEAVTDRAGGHILVHRRKPRTYRCADLPWATVQLSVVDGVVQHVEGDSSIGHARPS